MSFAVIKRKEAIESKDFISENSVFSSQDIDECLDFIKTEIKAFDVSDYDAENHRWFGRPKEALYNNYYFVGYF